MFWLNLSVLVDLCLRAVIITIVSPLVWISPTPLLYCLPWMQYSQCISLNSQPLLTFFFLFGKAGIPKGDGVGGILFFQLGKGYGNIFSPGQ